MGKQGPCYHCGVTSTPLWRNGPPEKPVLCNACGSRWRTKGTLENYTPLHARAEPDEFDDHRVSMMKTISIKNKEPKVLKRKYDNNISEYGGVPTDHYTGFPKGFDEDTSNRSSTGSAVSNSESCAQYGCADASDLTGPSRSIVWDAMVPSRKRTCVTRPKPSPVEKLTKDLYTIWHEQQSSCLSASSEEELLLNSDKPMVSVEIGHGSVLIRHPSSIALEEESEASSLSIDNKQHASNSRMVAFPGVIEDTSANLSSRGIDKIKKPTNPKTEQERLRRDKDQLEKLQILAHHNSPLCYIDLQDILNLDTFASHLTNEEQQHLLKFLPSIDTSEPPDRDSFSIFSLRSMFNSLQFKENLSSFQKLLADGLFDNSLSGLKPGDCRVLQKLVLSNLTKSKWVKQYKIIKDMKGKSIMNESAVAGFSDAIATDFSLATGSSQTMRKPQDGLNKKLSGAKTIIKSPGRMMMTSSYNQVLQSSDFADDSCEQDLLLDVPSNGSFPQAELLPASSFSAQVTTSSSSAHPYFVRP